jgi:hypothetical protein
MTQLEIKFSGSLWEPCSEVSPNVPGPCKIPNLNESPRVGFLNTEYRYRFLQIDITNPDDYPILPKGNPYLLEESNRRRINGGFGYIQPQTSRFY